MCKTGGKGVEVIVDHVGSATWKECLASLAPGGRLVTCGATSGGGSPEQKAAWLPKIASGETILTPAWLEPQHGFGPRGVALEATRDGATYRLSGTKRHVAFASSADRLLVLARTGAREDKIDLFLVDPKAPGVTLTQQRSLASDTQYAVVLQDVLVTAADRIGKAGSGWATWHRAMLDGIILLAAQAMGGAQRAPEMTVQYAKERYQFDKALGAFQALAHYMADATTSIDGGRGGGHGAAGQRQGPDVGGRRSDRA